MNILTHQIPFQVLRLSDFFQETTPSPLRMNICGTGEIFPSDKNMKGTKFILVDIPSLKQSPNELHTVVVPENICLGHSLILSRDPELGDFLSVELKNGNKDNDLFAIVAGKDRRPQIWYQVLVYRKNKAHFDLIKIDGRDVT